MATADPSSGLDLDAYLTATDLSAGQYTLAITDFELNQAATATNLSDGFTANYGDGTNFIDGAGNVLSGDYALSVDVAQTPEPATLWMIAPMFVVFGLVGRKRALSSK